MMTFTEPSFSLVMALQMLFTSLWYTPSLKRRFRFLLRCSMGISLFLCLSAFGYGIPEDLRLFILPVIVYLAFAALFLWLFDEDWKKQCFVFLTCVATQHAAVAATDTLRVVLRTAPDSPGWFFACVIGFALVLSACYLHYGRNLRRIIQVRMQPVRLLFAAFILFTLVYLLRVKSVSQIWILPDGNPLKAAVNLYDLVGSLATLEILFSGNREDTLAEENRIIEQLLHERESQERMTSDAIELVNMKYHDMKHLVTTLRCSGKRQEALEELERELPQYDCVVRTGSEALDAVLGNKLSICQAGGISLNCMIDGGKLGFLSTADLYALFGNLLDNAIEAVRQEREEQRIISLQASEKRGYLCIHVENYCSCPPPLENGLPKTRKQDERFHGFGMKSIRYIAEKYGGYMTVTSQEQQFCVDLLFPCAT